MRRLRQTRRASVAVEFALLATFLLLPLLAGASDFVVIIAAKAQLNTALDALYLYAETNPTRATTATTGYNDANSIISSINTNTTVYSLSFPANYSGSNANGSATYICYTTGAAAPTFSAPSTTNTCTGSQTAEVFANYLVTVTVNMPFPLPIHLTNPLTLSSSGSVQTQ